VDKKPALALALMLVLSLTPAAAAASPAVASEVGASLSGAEQGALTLRSEVHLNESITLSGARTITLEEGARLILGPGGSVAVPAGSSLELSGPGQVEVAGGRLRIQGELVVGCPLTLSSPDALEVYSRGSAAKLRVASGGTLRTENTEGWALRCDAVNYNALVLVERSGRLELKNTGGTGLVLADMGADFARAALRVEAGGQLWVENGGSAALDAREATGTYLTLEDEAQLFWAAGEQGFLGPEEGICLSEDAAIVRLTNTPLPLSEDAGKTYLAVRPELSGPEVDFGLTGSWTGGPVAFMGADYHPVREGETLLLEAEGHAPTRLVAEGLVPGGTLALTLGMKAPDKAAPSPPLLWAAGIGAVLTMGFFSLSKRRR
jgi:hypothetical protein